MEKFLKELKCSLQIAPEFGACEIEGFLAKSGQPIIFPANAAAMFVNNGKKMKLVLREKATLYECFHELIHLRHARMLGLSRYYSLGTTVTGKLIKEQYVFDKIIENKALFTRKEINNAWHYLNNTIYEIYRKEPVPFGFDINEIPEVRKEVDMKKSLKLSRMITKEQARNIAETYLRKEKRLCVVKPCF